MERYELSRATRCFAPFVDDLSNWYVRRSRRRFWKSESDEDKQQAYETLYTVLLTLAKLLAPFAPFVADEIYRNLTNNQQLTANNGEGKRGDAPSSIRHGKGVPISRGARMEGYPESVHLCDFPQANEDVVDEQLREEMKMVRDIVTRGLELRASAKIKVRQPLASIAIQNTQHKIREALLGIIQDELNVKEVAYGEEMLLDTDITPELKREGQAREIVRIVQEMRKKAGYKVDDRIILGYSGMDEVFNRFGEEIIAKETLATKIFKGQLTDAEREQSVSLDGEGITLAIKR